MTVDDRGVANPVKLHLWPQIRNGTVSGVEHAKEVHVGAEHVKELDPWI